MLHGYSKMLNSSRNIIFIIHQQFRHQIHEDLGNIDETDYKTKEKEPYKVKEDKFDDFLYELQELTEEIKSRRSSPQRSKISDESLRSPTSIHSPNRYQKRRESFKLTNTLQSMDIRNQNTFGNAAACLQNSQRASKKLNSLQIKLPYIKGAQGRERVAILRREANSSLVYGRSYDLTDSSNENLNQINIQASMGKYMKLLDNNPRAKRIMGNSVKEILQKKDEESGCIGSDYARITRERLRKKRELQELNDERRLELITLTQDKCHSMNKMRFLMNKKYYDYRNGYKLQSKVTPAMKVLALADEHK